MTVNFDNMGNMFYVPTSFHFSDTHGGNEELHFREIAEMCNRVVDKKLEIFSEALEQRFTEIVCQQVQEAVEEAQRKQTSDKEKVIAEFVKALEHDVETDVSIAFENGVEILKDKKTQKTVAEAVIKEIKKYLK